MPFVLPPEASPRVPPPPASPTVSPSAPPVTNPAMLDNPPRVRVIGAGISPPLNFNPTEPLIGLSYIDLLNIRVAMEQRLNQLQAQNEPDSLHLASVQRVLNVVLAKISPHAPDNNAPSPLMGRLTAASGLKPIPVLTIPKP